MIVGVARLEFHMPENASLKDKRRVIKSLIERARRKFNVAIAEVDATQAWERAVLGLCCVARGVGHAQRTLDSVIRWLDRETHGQLVRYESEFL